MTIVTTSGALGVSKLAASAIPFIIAPTGTMANNGAITLGTALPTIYANAYINLPASAISAGSAAGWYFCQMSSTTVGTVFNNTYTSGAPTIPASPTAFSTTGPGAYTGVTGAVTGQQVTLPAGALGPNGVLRITSLWSLANNVNSKTEIVKVGSVSVLNGAPTSVASDCVISTIYNRGAQNVNIALPNGNTAGSGTAGAAATQTAIDTSTAQTIAVGGNMAVATDYLVSEGFLVEVIPS